MRTRRWLAFVLAIACGSATFQAAAAADKPAANFRKQMAEKFDADGNGKLNAMERGNVRVHIGSLRAQRGLKVNGRVVGRIR